MDSQMTEMAPIRKMPTELITEIISYTLDNGMNNQSIASVCKAWRVIVLGTSRFWRHISIGQWASTADSVMRLRRALKLSGSVTLDVELYWHSIVEDTQHQLLDHLRTLADAGTHRWRSLALRGCPTSLDQPNPIHGIFTGKLSSLRSLTVYQSYPLPNQQDIFEPIYSLIAETSPCLDDFGCFLGEIPETLARLPIYRHLKSISASATTIARLRPKFDLPEVHITTNTFEAFELPYTTIFSVIKFTQLSKCRLDSVKVLEVQRLLRKGRNNINDSSEPKILKFPKLCALKVYVDLGDDLSWLFDIEAPELLRLTVIDPNQRDSRLTKGIVNDIFGSEKQRIKISPTHLDFCFLLNIASTLRVLKQWPQIQDLTLYWNQGIKWDGQLLSGLRNKDRDDNTLCPDLHVLRIVMWSNWSQKAIDTWLQAAHQILNARKGVLPLWKITLTGRWGPPALYSVTIFDID